MQTLSQGEIITNTENIMCVFKNLLKNHFIRITSIYIKAFMYSEANGLVVIDARPGQKNRWLKPRCGHSILFVVALDKVFFIYIVSIHPAEMWNRHTLGVNLRWTCVPSKKSQ